MINNPRISIIVPIYNVEQYLKKCIDSILNQSFKDFELILVDDGSPDNCGKTCDEYAKNDSRIRVIHKENGGLSDARNAGLDIAKGEYIGFVDSDDWIHEDMYELLYTAITEHKAQISECKKVSMENDNHSDDKYFEEPRTEVVSGSKASENMLCNGKSNYVTVWTKLYHISIFNKLKFKLNVLHEDNFFTFQAYYHSKMVVNVDRVLYYHRINPNGITQSAFSLRRLDAIDAYLEQLTFYESCNEKKLYDLTLYMLLDIIKWNYFCVYKYVDIIDLKKRELKKLKNVFNSYYLPSVLTKYIALKSKIGFLVFLVMPWIYTIYYDCKFKKKGIIRKNDRTNKI